MSFTNDQQAFCLANTYGLNPPVATYPSRTRNTSPGKYEPDHDQTAETRCIVLAHWFGATNIIIQYRPTEIET